MRFCVNNLKNITNRVLVQVSPSKVYDKQAVLDQCYSYDRAFAEAGVSRDRFAIKIPSTGPGLSAAKILNAEGIRTLGTSLFSLPQAIAASQAGCLYVSPYFNGASKKVNCIVVVPAMNKTYTWQRSLHTRMIA